MMQIKWGTELGLQTFLCKGGLVGSWGRSAGRKPSRKMDGKHNKIKQRLANNLMKALKQWFTICPPQALRDLGFIKGSLVHWFFTLTPARVRSPTQPLLPPVMSLVRVGLGRRQFSEVPVLARVANHCSTPTDTEQCLQMEEIP